VERSRDPYGNALIGKNVKFRNKGKGVKMVGKKARETEEF